MADSSIYYYNLCYQTDTNYTLALENLANIYFNTGNTKEAIYFSELILKRDPYNIRIRCNLGGIQSNMSQFNKAIETLNKCLQLDPQYKQVYRFVRITSLKMGDQKKANENLSKAN